MASPVSSLRHRLATAIYSLLNPLPFGMFFAALIFDVVYLNTAVTLWIKSAAWLIALGLIVAIVPRLINLFQVWVPPSRSDLAQRLDFWLNLFAVVLATLNAFVHSRDAYAAVPQNVLLSVGTVVLIAVGHLVISLRPIHDRGGRHA